MTAISSVWFQLLQKLTLGSGLGDFYKHERKTTLALDYYCKAAQLAPRKGKDRAPIFREYGMLLRDAGTPDAFQKATDALEIALEETPNDPVCIFVLGQVLIGARLNQKFMRMQGARFAPEIAASLK